MYLRLMYIVSKLKIRQQYINRETHFPHILSTMIYNFVVPRVNYQRNFTQLNHWAKICVKKHKHSQQ